MHMTIFISSSMTFTMQILDIKKQLEAKGFTVLIPLETEDLAKDVGNIEAFKVDLENAHATDILKKNFDEVAKADALLTLNLDKRGVKGYVGPSALMEMGIAYYLKKKLFLWQEVPHWDEVPWGYEVRMMQPTILHGDLSKIN